MNRKAFVSGLVSVALLLFGLTGFVPVFASAQTPSAEPAVVLEPVSQSSVRKTVCRQGCDFISVSAAVSATHPLTPSVISILDGEVSESQIRIDQGKVVAISGLGAQRTKVGADLSQPTIGPIFIIEDGADVTLSDLTIWGGSTPNGAGGGMTISGSGTIVQLNTVNITNNHAKLGGGVAVKDEAILFIGESIISQNSATNEGGGIVVDGGELTLERSLVQNNHATAGGGIAYASDQLNGTIENTTIAYNTAEIMSSATTTKRGGGAIYVSNQMNGSQSSGLDISFSTISQNDAADGGGGLLVAGGTLTTFASIYTDNQAGKNLENCKLSLGSIISLGYNLATESSCHLSQQTDLVLDTMKLAPLADYGGPTNSFAIEFESRALGVVPATHCPAVDQRNLSRLGDDACDAGAYESEKYLTFCRTAAQPIPDNNSAGLTDSLSINRTETIFDLSILLQASIQSGFVEDFEASLSFAESSPTVIDLISKPSNGQVCTVSPSKLDLRFNDAYSNQLTGSACFASSSLVADYQPLSTADSFGALNGKSLNLASWDLNLVDGAAGALGTLENWCVQAQIKPDQLIVTRADDPAPDGCHAGDCSLREAIIDAASYPGRDEISFAVAGPILLTRTGNGGNSTGDTPEIGDLDIIDDLRIVGNITDVITIDASGLNDRIFDIYAGTKVEMSGLELTGGIVSSGPRGGAAILNRATFFGDHLLIRNNGTINQFGYGAAIQSTGGGDLTLRNSEIISNSVSGSASFSGIYNWNSVMELTGVTIAGNSGSGSVVYNFALGGDSVLWMNSVTLAQNRDAQDNGLESRYGSGVNKPEAAMTYLHNSVIGDHAKQGCKMGGTSAGNSALIVSLGYNLDTDDSCGLAVSSDLSAGDPLLGELQAGDGGSLNGRLILKPDPLSPLHDNGDPEVCPSFDGRGASRPQHTRCDIGAVELTTAEVPTRIFLPFIIR